MKSEAQGANVRSRSGFKGAGVAVVCVLCNGGAPRLCLLVYNKPSVSVVISCYIYHEPKLLDLSINLIVG